MLVGQRVIVSYLSMFVGSYSSIFCSLIFPSLLYRRNLEYVQLLGSSNPLLIPIWLMIANNDLNDCKTMTYIYIYVCVQKLYCIIQKNNELVVFGYMRPQHLDQVGGALPGGSAHWQTASCWNDLGHRDVQPFSKVQQFSKQLLAGGFKPSEKY